LRGKQLLDAYVGTKIKSERLEHERIKAENRSLREQVNPHFLFNSLNTLSELVMDNPQAEMFVDKLASVYRYLLQNNQNDLCLLESEMRFAKSYFHLLETRHGSAVRLEVHVEPNAMTKQLPPMTLQLLIENAIKHNAISIQEPLTIRIHSQGNNLVVENNIRKRSGNILSGKVGLSNIITKYKLLGKEEVQIFHDAENFKVEIPLLEG
jgi:two-component system, LytTR family, sensor kinase